MLTSFKNLSLTKSCVKRVFTNSYLSTKQINTSNIFLVKSDKPIVFKCTLKIFHNNRTSLFKEAIIQSVSKFHLRYPSHTDILVSLIEACLTYFNNVFHTDSSHRLLRYYTYYLPQITKLKPSLAFVWKTIIDMSSVL